MARPSQIEQQPALYFGGIMYQTRGDVKVYYPIPFLVAILLLEILFVFAIIFGAVMIF